MKYILLFDGVCNLCNSTVNFTIKRDMKGKFRFAPLQSQIGQVFLKKFSLSTTNFDSFVLIKEDEYLVKSSAIINVLKELGGVWKLFYVFILVPKPLRDFIYDIVAKTRYKTFGRGDTCMMPTPEIRQRFLQEFNDENFID